MTEFTHLHLHSEYSLLDGVGKIKDYASKLSELGYKAAAITDHGNLYGAHEWWETLSKAGIKPIIGIEAYLADGNVSDRNRKNYHLLLLAQNDAGYRNLLQLSTGSYLRGFYYYPRIDLNELRKFSEGIICTSACVGGPVALNLLQGESERAERKARDLAEIFSQRFFIEIQDHGLPDQRTTNQPLIDLARKLGLPLVCTNDTHYVNQADSFTQDLLMCIQTGKALTDPTRLRPHSDQMYLKSPKEMTALFGDIPQAMANTMAISEMCNVDLSFKGYHLPHFEVPSGFTPETYLQHLVRLGAQWKYGTLSEVVQKRIEYELSVIIPMGFATYFLIVFDFVRFAKEKNILVGAGRGSAAGSIVAYCLDITAVDPLKYDLIFERFLMPGRVGMPDIDIDFDSTRRAEVIDYVIKKYGDDRVAQMATFGSLNARSALRDVGRAMGMSYAEVDRVSQYVPNTVGMNLKIAMNTVPELQALYSSDTQVRALVDSAFKVEGIARHASTHAAGLVISKEPLVQNVPLQKIGKGERKEVVTQFSMNHVEAIGLLKMDFLGLSMLTVLSKTNDLIRQKKDPNFNIDHIPWEDEETFVMLRRGETVGLFQLEGNMNTFLIKALAPTKIEDIMAQIALSRPGPRDLAFEYIERKHGRAPVVYDHPLMEEALHETFGVMVYQEQVIKIANILAGFSLTEGEGLRKAIAKKHFEGIYIYRGRFVAGCEERGINSELANHIFDLIERFGWYALNKAHSAGYAITGYQSAYVKCHYPSEFLAAWLSTEMDNPSEITRIISEARRIGIEILPPSINKSGVEFQVEEENGTEKIRYGLAAIKSVPLDTAHSIVLSRGTGYTSMAEVCREIDWKRTTRKALENLAKAGAFDDFGGRITAINSIEDAITSGQTDQRARGRGQLALFDVQDSGKKEFIIDLVADKREIPKQTILGWERETLGVYLSAHPLAELDGYIEQAGYPYINELTDFIDREWLDIVAVASSIRKVITKQNRAMSIVRLEDITGWIEMIVFPDTYDRVHQHLETGNILRVTARMDQRDGKFQLVCENLSQDLPQAERFVHVYMPADISTDEMYNVDGVLQQHPGSSKVVLHLGHKTFLAKKYLVEISSTLIIRISNILGRNGIKISNNIDVAY